MNTVHVGSLARARARARQALSKRAWAFCTLTLNLGFCLAACGAGSVFDVRDHGAAGDGKASDTLAIQKALDACSVAGGGQVLLPPGRYLSGSLRLPSQTTLYLEAGARLVGTTNLAEYRQPTPPDFMPEAKWGKWHRALLFAENAEDIAIAGAGIIDGNKVFDPTGEERMRGPHGFAFVNCRRVSVRDVTFLDAANYAVFFQISDEVDFRNVTFVGGWDGIHWRGAPSRWCHHVSISQCRFFTGDDSIAGRYWDNTVISDCLINSSCNGIRLIGPATRLVIHDCLFKGPGEQPHRTSGERRRTNMLAAINLQPGAWDATEGLLDDVLISDVTVHNASTPFHFALKPGNTAGRITVERASVTGAYLAAASVESWADSPFTNVVFRDVSMEFAGGGRPAAATAKVAGPGVDARPLPAWGFYGRNVAKLTLEGIRFRISADDARPAILLQDVDRLELEAVSLPHVEPGAKPVVFEGVQHWTWPEGGVLTNAILSTGIVR